MAPTIGSPNPDNYGVGKGILVFKPEGSAEFFDLGNVPEFEFTPAVEKLDHFSSRAGTRTKDKSIVIERSGTARIVMEEWTPRNLALLLMGDVDLSGPEPTIDIFSKNVTKGHLKFYGTNDVGPRWNYDFPNVEFSPSGSLSPISEEWGSFEVTGEVLEDPDTGKFGTATMVNLNAEQAAPFAYASPTISGFMSEDEVLTADVGSWIDADSFTYQWQAEEVNTATTETITLAAGDEGKKFDLTVTGTNENGSTPKVAESRWFGPPVNSVAPAITGTAEVGETLTVTNGTWTGMPTFTRQWYADDVAIVGATGLTYDLTGDELGAVITVTVTATSGGGVTSADSNATAAVGP